MALEQVIWHCGHGRWYRKTVALGISYDCAPAGGGANPDGFGACENIWALVDMPAIPIPKLLGREKHSGSRAIS